MLALAFAIGIWIQAAQAVVLDVNDKGGYVEYLGVTGAPTERNAPFRMVVPANWKGKLLVYARVELLGTFYILFVKHYFFAH